MKTNLSSISFIDIFASLPVIMTVIAELALTTQTTTVSIEIFLNSVDAFLGEY